MLLIFDNAIGEKLLNAVCIPDMIQIYKKYMNEVKILSTMLELNDRVGSLEVNAVEVDKKLDQIITGNDHVIKILNRMEAGLAGSVSRDDRIEKRVNRHDVEIKGIKTHLKIA